MSKKYVHKKAGMLSRHGGQGSNLDLLPVQQKHFDIETSKPLLFIRQLRRIKLLLIPALPFAYLCPAQDDCRGCCHMVTVFTSKKKKSLLHYCPTTPPGIARFTSGLVANRQAGPWLGLSPIVGIRTQCRAERRPDSEAAAGRPVVGLQA